jgi:hypothetical protein
MIDALPYLLFGIALFFAVMLSLVNYVGRVKKPEQYIEANKPFRDLDSKNHAKTSIFLMFLVQFLLLSLGFFLSIQGFELGLLFLSFLLGIIGMNFYCDASTLYSKASCENCDFYPKRTDFLKKCRQCPDKLKAGNLDIIEFLKWLNKSIREK